jgi:hypothetical protein
MINKDLQENYQNACNAYLKVFCVKHDYLYEDDMWVGNIPGTVAMCGDECYSMETIKTDIDKDAPKEELLKWYDYTIDANEFKLPVPNFMQWLMGCPTTPKKWFEEMRAKRKELENMIKEERERY